MSKINKLELYVVRKIKAVDYYNKMISPIDSKFKPVSESSAYGLCPFHKDTDPSLRIWKPNKSDNNIERFKCFGCGVGGTVIDIHIMLMKKYYNKSINRKESVEELCNIFGVDIPKQLEEEVEVNVFERAKQLALKKSYIPKDKITLIDYKRMNKRIKNYNISEGQKAKNYNKLDIELALQRINSLE